MMKLLEHIAGGLGYIAGFIQGLFMSVGYRLGLVSGKTINRIAGKKIVSEEEA